MAASSSTRDSGRAQRRPTDQVDGRTTRWNDHKAGRRRHLVNAAIELIGSDGIDVGVQQIASHAGLPRSVVYRVFTDRSDLDEQIRSGILEDLTAALGPAMVEPEGTISGAVNLAIRTYVGWIVANPHLHQFLSVGSARNRTTNSPAVTGSRKDFAYRLTDLLRLIDVDPAVGRMAESVAFGLIGFVDGTVNHWLARTKDDPDSGTEVLITFLVTSVDHILVDALTTLGIDVAADTPITELMPARTGT